MSRKTPQTVVIGAGLAGLASACRLAAGGHHVTVIERTETWGGKCGELEKNGYRFDTGPSLVTMPFVLEEFYHACGTSLEKELTLVPVEPTCRYFHKPGEKPLDLYADTAKNQLEPSEKAELQRFLKYSEDLWNRTAHAFVLNPLYELKDFRGLNLPDMLRIDAHTTLNNAVEKRLKSERLRLIFKRFATYNGSDPWQTPGTMNVIPHVELTMGAFYPKGGLRSIPDSLYRLATSLGVTFVFNETVSRLETSGRTVTAVHTASGSSFYCNYLVSNADAAYFHSKLLPETFASPATRRFSTMEPSCSGFILLLGVKKKFPQLEHHSLFFSSDYRKEFKQLFQDRVPADDPTIYIANTSKTDSGHAPEGCSNLFVLVNAPYTSDAWQWNPENTTAYRERILQRLRSFGIEFQEADIEMSEVITPHDFEERYLTNRGSIYGFSSNNSFAAFLRPRNKVRQLENVYLTGGSTHPGGGIPLVFTSAKHAHTLLNRVSKNTGEPS